MIMNSLAWIQRWIHTYEFWHEFTIFFIIMNSYLNSYYEFIWDFMIMNSYVKFHDLWIHIWIHVYEEYREIIPEFLCTKVPDVPPGSLAGSVPLLTGRVSIPWLTGRVSPLAHEPSQYPWHMDRVLGPHLAHGPQLEVSAPPLHVPGHYPTSNGRNLKSARLTGRSLPYAVRVSCVSAWRAR